MILAAAVQAESSRNATAGAKAPEDAGLIAKTDIPGLEMGREDIPGLSEAQATA